MRIERERRGRETGREGRREREREGDKERPGNGAESIKRGIERRGT